MNCERRRNQPDMPSRALTAKAVLCATNSRPRWPGAGSRVRTVVAHSSHGSIGQSTPSLSILDDPFFHTRRHHHHYSISMDETLAKLFSANAQWAKAVTDAEPDFFERSAKAQYPKVRCRSRSSSSHPHSCSCPTRTDSLARMFRLPCPRKRHHCLAPRFHLRPSQHRQVSNASYAVLY